MGKGEVEEQEDVFQAILLADNFGVSIFGSHWYEKQNPGGSRFSDDEEEDDDSIQKKKKGEDMDATITQESLMLLGNRRLIDYSLEALTVSGVQEIFIFCSSGTRGGDALKEHIRNTKWSDLPVKIQVICSEDCQSLGDALRELDAKGMIRNDFILMSTGVLTNRSLKPMLDKHRQTMKADKGAVMTLIHRVVPDGHRSRSKNTEAIVIDGKTGKILNYYERCPKKNVKIPLVGIKNEMEIFLDTVDSGIAVCSASVLPLFTDNFDFADMVDFVKGILMNEEIMGNTIYANRFTRGYANRIIDFDTYLGISNDITERWTYPLVPDMPFGFNPNDDVYSMHLNFVYRVSNVETARSATIGPNAIIGSKTVIQERAKIRRSSIGNNCVIGKDVVINNCQIGNNVTIQNGSFLSKCIILDGTVIKPSSKIGPMVIYAAGNVCKIVVEDNYENSEDEEETDDDDEMKSEGSMGADVDHQEGDNKRFCAEVLESIQRAFTDNVDLENLAVEIHGSRTANFMYFDDVPRAVVKGIVGVPLKLHSNLDEQPLKNQWEITSAVMVKFKKLMPQYVKTEKAQQSVLQALEEYALDNAYFRPLLMKVLHYYYDIDILSQELIINWYKSPSDYEGASELRKTVEKFIEWLETASEESDSDEDDDE